MGERVVEMSNEEEKFVVVFFSSEYQRLRDIFFSLTIKKNVRRCPVYLFALVGTLLIASIVVLATLFALERRQNLTQQQNYISGKFKSLVFIRLSVIFS